MNFKKGEIWKANLSPAKDSEQKGYRPVLVVSGNLLNTYSPVIYICPITSKVKNYKGNILLSPSKTNGLHKKSEVLNLHLRSVSKNRLIKKIGNIEAKDLDLVREGIQEITMMD